MNNKYKGNEKSRQIFFKNSNFMNIYHKLIFGVDFLPSLPHNDSNMIRSTEKKYLFAKGTSF